MAETHPSTERTQLLQRLAGLRCQAIDADAVAHFVEERTLLLGDLNSLTGPWSTDEQALLKEALRYGERVLKEVGQYRHEMVKQLSQVQQAKQRGHSTHRHVLRGRLTRVF